MAKERHRPLRPARQERDDAIGWLAAHRGLHTWW